MKKQMRKILCVALVIVLVLGMTICLGGCGDKDEVTKVTYPIVLYFVSDYYIETGDDSKDPLVKYDGIAIECDENTDDQYETALTMLWDEPEDLDDVDSIVTEKFGIHDVYVKEGTAYVDLVGENLSGGSMEEILFISQIVFTLGNSFDEIEYVQFLVDGEVAESLMGHYDVTEPISVAEHKPF